MQVLCCCWQSGVYFKDLLGAASPCLYSIHVSMLSICGQQGKIGRSVKYLTNAEISAKGLFSKPGLVQRIPLVCPILLTCKYSQKMPLSAHPFRSDTLDSSTALAPKMKASQFGTQQRRGALQNRSTNLTAKTSLRCTNQVPGSKEFSTA